MSALDPCLAVIPARGGSKGLPGKNVRPLAGRPLIGHSLRCAASTKRLGVVVVSTDSEEIAAVARAEGGDVPFLRPPEIARDDTPMIPVLQHALAEMERRGDSFGSVLLLDPTSPGRLPEDIERAFERLDADPTADGIVACSRPSFNPFWVGVVERNGVLAPAFGREGSYQRRQDVPTFYRINGALYLWRRDFIARTTPDWRQGRHLLLEVPDERSFSIDSLHDFEVADLLIQSGTVRLPWLEPGS